MPDTMRRIQIYIDEKRWKKLNEHKQRTGAPISEIIRRCVDEFLKKIKK